MSSDEEVDEEFKFAKLFTTNTNWAKGVSHY